MSKVEADVSIMVENSEIDFTMEINTDHTLENIHQQAIEHLMELVETAQIRITYKPKESN